MRQRWNWVPTQRGGESKEVREGGREGGREEGGGRREEGGGKEEKG